jgi:hypothetical protein
VAGKTREALAEVGDAVRKNVWYVRLGGCVAQDCELGLVAFRMIEYPRLSQRSLLLQAQKPLPSSAFQPLVGVVGLPFDGLVILSQARVRDAWVRFAAARWVRLVAERWVV